MNLGEGSFHSVLASEAYSRLPNIGAIYLIVDGAKDDVLYVGMAGNLKCRWACHAHRRKAEQSGYRLMWTEEPLLEDRKAKEKSLINLLDPPLNKKVIGRAPKRVQIASGLPVEVFNAINAIAISQERTVSKMVMLLLADNPLVQAEIRKAKGNTNGKGK